MFSFQSDLKQIKSFIKNLESNEIQESDKERLIGMIRPTIGVKTKPSEDQKLKLGTSKLGGNPDLPENYQWPDRNGKPMIFCAQYNLAELAKYDKDSKLPKHGLFYLFMALDENDEFDSVNPDFHFLYLDSKKVKRTSFPSNLQDNYKLKAADIGYFQFYTIPDDENYKLDDLYEKYDDMYFHLYQPIEDYLDEKYFDYSENYHQVLGHDRAIQSSVVYDFAAKDLGIFLAETEVFKGHKKELLEISTKYEVLLQIFCDDPNNDMQRIFGYGVLYLGISKIDLENKIFTNIKITYQGT